MRPDETKLRMWWDTWPHVGDRIVLTAIALDRQNIATDTFSPSEWEQAKEWVRQRNEVLQWNVYFGVNPTIASMKKKPGREDIAAMTMLHLDLDPRAGEDLTAEQDRIWKLLHENRPAGIPEPSAIIFSGGGYAAYWFLETPFKIDGQEALYEDAKRYNQALELAFGADECHNVDRIMRLPGTVNWPNELKRKKARREAISDLREFKGTRYLLSQFKQAPAPAQGAAAVNVDTATIARIDYLDMLPDKVSDLCKVVIAQGTDPDNPARFPSRSEALFFVVCELIRADLDDSTIFGIITDPDWAISESVLDKGRKADSYAKRQIQRARDKAIDPALLEMNDKYAVVLKPKTRVLSFMPDEVDRGRELIVLQTFDDIRNGHMNRKVAIGTDAQGNAKYAPLGDWWLKHEKRRTFTSIQFRPDVNDDIIDGEHFNLWRGFGVEPKGGDWSLMQQHVKEVLASGNPEWAEYILKWCAWAVRHPDRPAEVALVFRGGKGVGKGCFGRAMRRLFGQHGLHISSSDQLTGRFNGHLRDCCLLFADEAVAPGDWQAEGRLKALITEPEIFIEGKGEKAIQVRNRLHVVMSSNADWVVHATEDERRYAVFSVPAFRRGDKPYFTAIARQMEDGGHAAMLYDMLAMDLNGWHPRDNVPQTDALAEQKDLTEADPWLDHLTEQFGTAEGKVRAADVWAAVGLADVSRRTQKDNERLGRIMKALGFKRTLRRFETEVERAYVRGGKDEERIVLSCVGDDRCL